MATVSIGKWVIYILVLYFITPTLPQSDEILPPIILKCGMPLIETEHEVFSNGCGLFCDDENAATPWTNRKSNRNISLIFLGLLIPAFICNMIFTINNITEHRENEENFSTTPITYDALFVWYFIRIFYLLFIHGQCHICSQCGILAHLYHVIGNNTLSIT